MDTAVNKVFGTGDVAKFYNSHRLTDHSREKCPLAPDVSKSLFDQSEGTFHIKEILENM